MQEITTIEDVSISAKWENDEIILIFKNCGQKRKEIDIRYKEVNDPGTKSLRHFQLHDKKSETVPLPEEYKNYQKLCFQVGKKKPWPNSIEMLKKLLEKVEKQAKSKYIQHGNEQLRADPEEHKDSAPDHEKLTRLSSSQGNEKQLLNPLKPLEETLAEIKRKKPANEQLSPRPEKQKNSTLSHEKLSGQLQLEHEIQSQEENTIPNLQNRITQLEQIAVEREKEIDSFKEQIAELTKTNSELRTQLDTQTNAMSRDSEHVFREAAHRILQVLFVQQENEVGETLQDPKQICEGIETEIKRFEAQFDGEMIYTLSVVKEHLTKVKGLIHFELSELPSPKNQTEQLAKLVLTEELPNDVQFPYLGELGKAYWNDLKTFAMKLPQIIVETQTLLHHIVIQLLDGFSPYRAKTPKEGQMLCCFYEEYLPNILRIMNLELVPVEIGKTEADSRIHDIQGSQRGAYQRGVVADIIQHGVRRISDKQIIRKPVVMRGEPE